MTYTMFEACDAPTPQESCSRRFQTVIPSQALTLTNNGLVLQWSQALAGRVLNDGGLSADQQIERAYRIVLSRQPTARERRIILDFLERQSAGVAQKLANSEKRLLPENPPPALEPARAAALAAVCHTLLNSNEFLYIN